MLRVWRRLLGLCTKTVLEDVEFDEDVGVVVAHCVPSRGGVGVAASADAARLAMTPGMVVVVGGGWIWGR